MIGHPSPRRTAAEGCRTFRGAAEDVGRGVSDDP
jgi:hypothetical protein